MCSLDDEPWRMKFTGPVCRCGLPTPGNEEEKREDEMQNQEARQKRAAKMKLELAKYKEDRLREIEFLRNYNNGF